VAKPGSLLPLFNSIGISDDSNAGAANIDGDGFSYSAQALAQAGVTPGSTVTVNGINYTWPNVPVATFDNIEVGGQTITVPSAQAGAAQLSFLGCATNGNSQGTVTITYTDGTTQTAQLGFSDWTLGAGANPIAYNNVVAIKTPYRNPNQQVTTYVFASAPITLDTSKTVASITLPSTMTGGMLHIFAFTLS
jgi:hypothetical protein